MNQGGYSPGSGYRDPNEDHAALPSYGEYQINSGSALPEEIGHVDILGLESRRADNSIKIFEPEMAATSTKNAS